MGSYSSSFVREGAVELRTTGTHPSKPNWITSHATVTELTIPEVERLWCRFQQLGCNEDGVLEVEVLKRPPASSDVFARNILDSFVGTDNRLIEFRTFLNAMKWAEQSDIYDKVRAVFNLLNRGEPVPKNVLQAVLRKTYTDDSEQEIERLTNVIMDQVDISKQGVMTADDFYQWVCETPKEIVTEILSFHIVPQELSPDASTGNPSIPTDSLLEQVAEKVYTRDWHLLLNQLGFTTADLQPFKQQFKSDVRRQVFEVLKAWRSKHAASATMDELGTALQQAGMTDIALKFFH
jgi:Ca2+-binding EF-hand superfamily protein